MGIDFIFIRALFHATDHVTTENGTISGERECVVQLDSSKILTQIRLSTYTQMAGIWQQETLNS